MMKKKLFFLLLAAVVMVGFTACGGSKGQVSSKLKGTPAEILPTVLEKATNALPEDNKLPMSFESDITRENCQGIGLKPEEFDKYVSKATASTGAIMTSAHEIVLLQAKNAASAAEVKKLIAAGFDSWKWICVAPEKSCVIESGNYVLLAVGRTAAVDAVIAAFEEAAGTVGDVNVFFTGGGAGEGGAGEGGAGGLPIQLQ